jgi:N-acetylmuramic acid 6-phosphate etherase
MKAGTAQKMVLNMLSTASMIRLGRVYNNWMIGVALTNRKLQARGLRILIEATGATVDDATRALRQSGHSLDVALIMIKKGLDAREAQRQLGRVDGNVHNALTREEQASKGRRKRSRTHG